ncbi:EAL domain-containing protein [Halioxenophilus sp. WMMB6]|uniref:EAL domain-containing protein n=1 Tax=Halioxenophilus sp. WMMB6 TaxID=3073815 RepID=UPI00295E7377|nr:EAL domain-containing protein [Halioxenophilus sp. WMMB6]
MTGTARQKLDNLIVFIASALIAGSLFFYAVYGLQQSFKHEITAMASAGLDRISEIENDILLTLQPLNQEKLSGCSKDTLMSMSQAMFRSKYIKDIGYLEGRYLQCTTGKGVVKVTEPETQPDYITPAGLQVWVYGDLMLFENQAFALVARLDSFNAIIKHDAITDLMPQQYPWELVFVAGQEYTYVSGAKGLMPENAHSSISLAYDYTQTLCSERVPYCLTVVATSSQFYKQNRVALIALAGVSGLLFVLIYLLMQKWLNHYRSIDSRILRGLKKGAFYCEYQPIVDLQQCNVIGCEVLARFKDRDSSISPLVFIPIIGRKDKTWDFTRVIINRCLQGLAEFSGIAASNFKVNINFFARDINSVHADELITLCDSYKNKVKFVIEVTEEESLTTESSIEALRKLRRAGFEVAIDDFGSGYSNLSQLKQLQCDTLKIDRSFINEMEDGSVRSTLIPHIVAIANNIDAQIVGEGIENNLQRQALIEFKVKYGQGYLFGKPMSLHDLTALMATNVNIEEC